MLENENPGRESAREDPKRTKGLEKKNRGSGRVPCRMDLRSSYNIGSIGAVGGFACDPERVPTVVATHEVVERDGKACPWENAGAPPGKEACGE